MAGKIVKEKDIIAKLKFEGQGEHHSEVTINVIIEKLGINPSNTLWVRGEKPNREWTNDSDAFEQSDYEEGPGKIIAENAAKEAHEAMIKIEVAKHLEAKELDELRKFKAERIAAEAKTSVSKK